MRKLILAAATTLAFGLHASRLEAQVTTTLSGFGGNVVGPVNGSMSNGGGGWTVNSSVGLGQPSITALTVYCFDNLRSWSNGAQYVALTFDEFLGNVGAGPGGRATNWNTITTADELDLMVTIISAGYNNASNAFGLSNNALQQAIWDIGNNVNNTNTVGSATIPTGSLDFSGSWMILVDKAEWQVGLTAQNGVHGSQSFLVQVPSARITTTTPEPSTYALMTAGLAALAVAARRRRKA